MIIATAAVMMLYVYLYICRSSSLDEKEKLSKIIITFLEDDAAPGNMKTLAYLSYVIAGKWWFFPIICLITPLVILFTKEKGIDAADKKVHEGGAVTFQDVMNSVVAVSMKRNPLTSIFFAASAALLAAIAICLRMIFGSLKSIPSINASILSTVNFIHTLRKKSHI